MKKIQKEMEQINVPKRKLEETINSAIEKGDRRVRRRKIFTGTAAAGLFLTISLGYFSTSPAMASFVSTIPILNSIIEPESDITERIDSKLKAENINLSYVNATYRPDKIIEVGVLSNNNEDFSLIKENVTNIVKDALQKDNLDAFSVKVFKVDKDDIQKSTKAPEKPASFEKEIMDTLNDHNINVVAYGISTKSKEVNMKIKASPEYFKDIKQNTEDMIRKILVSNNQTGYSINLKRQDEYDDNVAIYILPSIGDEIMGKKMYNATSISYSLDPELTIIIKTSIPDSSAESKEFGTRMERNIKTILSSEKTKPLLEGKPYSIKIYNQEQEQINL
ncbi:DUF4030 domain-containing protein [Peribacillus simplex]|uniref:DUF4030 domain-containing protein n=1 Tax=Peribacillus simplex TaxID=1478 RepID=UPI00203CC5F6|nr:DUF4030 domain-containing protein [Peribacillus simplex]MCM3677430.1 DUF4030 domain-containing protein [Peribacillus simplex]